MSEMPNYKCRMKKCFMLNAYSTQPWYRRCTALPCSWGTQYLLKYFSATVYECVCVARNGRGERAP